ncbi:MAG: hypothetical protein IKP00_07965 [Victivallales bacterium]|nr:hypothetical protein [Victivallales bacterium]
MKSVFALMGIALSLLAFEEVNILKSIHFTGNEYFMPGTLDCWNVDACDIEFNPIKVLKGEAPDGGNAVRINIPQGEVFRQQNIYLVAGEKYRFGGFVRTSGFNTPTSSIRVWNNGWTKELISPEIPADTHGKWVKIEKEGIMPTSPNGRYTYGIYAKTPSGTLDFACPYLIPLSEKALAGSKVDQEETLMLNRIVPVYPLLMKIDVAAPSMRFFVSTFLEKEETAYRLGVQTRMKADAEWSPIAYYEFGKDQLVDTKLGKLPLGDGKLRVALYEKAGNVQVTSNEYDIRVIQTPPKANLKRLNNMVHEILDVPLKNGETIFDNPRDGWVFIGFDKPYPAAKAYLDGDNKPIVLYREDEPSDTMRLLPLGKHSLRIESAPEGGRLLIRSVAQIMLYPLAIHEKKDINNFRYDLPFFRKHLLHSINFFDTETWLPKTPYQLKIDAEVAERGLKITGSRWLFAHEKQSELDKMEEAIRNNPTLQRNWGITIDELALTSSPNRINATAEALWRMTDMEKRVYLWCCGVTNAFFSIPRLHHNLLSAGSNVSQSEGKIFLETYVGTRRTEADVEKYLEYIPKHLEIARKLTPDAGERFMMLMSGYTTPEVWNINNYPEADIKVLFDRFFNILATDPRMDGLYGMGCYSIGHTDEELVRWIGKLMRYYCVEGGTEPLSKKYGFKYNPGHLKDGDFEEGFKHWTIEPAEQDGIQLKKLTGYGRNIQCRKGIPSGHGDTVALFTRSVKAPNRLSQKAVGLTPGKLYCLSFMTVDYDDYLKPNNKHLEVVFNATISDAELIPEVCCKRVFPIAWGGKGDTRPGTPEKIIQRIVFRAQKETATITFSDWSSDTEAGGPAGVHRIINWIGVKPYFQ